MSRRSKSDLEGEDAERDKLDLEARLVRPEVKVLLESIRAKGLRLHQDGERTFETAGGGSLFFWEQRECQEHGVFPMIFPQPHGPPTIHPVLTAEARAERQAVTPIGVVEAGRYMTFRVDTWAARRWRDAHFMFWMDTFERFPVGIKRPGREVRRRSVKDDHQTLAMLRDRMNGVSVAAIARTNGIDRTAVARRLRKFCAQRGLHYPRHHPDRSDFLGLVITDEERTTCEACTNRSISRTCPACPWRRMLDRSDRAEPKTRELISKRSTE